MDSSLTLAQQRALAILPKITGSLSFLFSLLIATTILRDGSRRKLCYHRLLFGISCADMSASLWMLMSTWPIPRDSGVVYAAGNAHTCTAQGFFLQFGVSSPFYNASLSIYYWLVIVRGWKEAQLHQIEWLFHALPLSWGAATAITGLALGVYDNANLWCWVDADYKVFRWAAYYGPLWTMISIATMACISIFLHVRQYGVAAHIKQQTIVMPTPAATTTTTVRVESTHHDDSSTSRPRPELPGDLDPVNEVEIDSSSDGQIVGDDEEDSDASDLYNLDSLDPFDEDEDEDETGEGHCECDHCTPTAGATAEMSSAFVSERSGRQFERRMVVPQTFCKNLQHSRYVYRQSRRLREIAHQCFWYAAAFYINFAALTATRVIQLVDQDKVYYPLVLAAAICVPVQGLPNFLIYLRPKFKKKLHHLWQKHFKKSQADSRPWWYRLAQSLSERKHHRHDNDDAGAPQSNDPERVAVGRHRINLASSTAIVNANPAIVNDTLVKKESSFIDPTASSTAELVVVDTESGRKWRIESRRSHTNNSSSERTLPHSNLLAAESDPHCHCPDVAIMEVPPQHVSPVVVAASEQDASNPLPPIANQDTRETLPRTKDPFSLEDDEDDSSSSSSSSTTSSSSHKSSSSSVSSSTSSNNELGTKAQKRALTFSPDSVVCSPIAESTL